MKTVNVVEQEQTYKWIQERLRQLHSGTLSEEDLRRLMEIAEHDPFVADALEGYTTHPDGEHAEYLEYLAEKITYRKRERRRWLIPNLTITAIAASLLIILATYAVLYRIDHTEKETTFVFVSPDSLGIHENDSFGVAMEQPHVEKPSPETIISASSSHDDLAEEPAPAKTADQTKAKSAPQAPPSVAEASEGRVQSDAPGAKANPSEPEWPEGFIAYLKANSRYPIDETLESSSKLVTLVFYTGEDGKPIRVEAMKSSAPDQYKAEALRLLKNSSGWICKNGNYPCRLECTLGFK